MLAKREILSEIKKGKIKIVPFKKENVGSCSVDLRLGYYFRKFKGKKRKIKVNEKINLSAFTKLIKLKKGQSMELKSGEMILGATLEKIKLNDDICGGLEGRSRFARIGLMVHVSSSLVQPGANNVQVLEIINLSPFTLVITPGLKICQIVFEKLSSKARYSGQFKAQKMP